MIDINMFNKSLKAGRLKGYPLALGIPSENTLVFWVSLVIYIKSNRNSISLLCISLLFTIKIKDSSNFQINDLRLMSFF